jgi:Rab GTPase-binding effector protein 1
MCANYEAQLQRVQHKIVEQERQNKLIQRAADRYREDLAKETEFRKEMENKWSEKKEEHRTQVERLSAAVIQTEQGLLQLTENFEMAQSEMTSQLLSLTQEREDVHKRLAL